MVLNLTTGVTPLVECLGVEGTLGVIPLISVVGWAASVEMIGSVRILTLLPLSLTAGGVTLPIGGDWQS